MSKEIEKYNINQQQQKCIMRPATAVQTLTLGRRAGGKKYDQIKDDTGMRYAFSAKAILARSMAMILRLKSDGGASRRKEITCELLLRTRSSNG